VGYVPLLKPVLRPFDDPVVAFPVVPVPIELPTLLEPATTVAAAPLVPAPTPPTCARAMDEVTARAEARAIVVSFMWFFSAARHRKRTAPTSGAGRVGPSLGSCRWGNRHKADVGLRSAAANKFRVTHPTVRPAGQGSGTAIITKAGGLALATVRNWSNR
jgi:hypothetical protein